MRTDPSSPAFFEAMYRANPDPWRFADDPYERARYNAIVAAVPARRFRLAFEPGCSVGELTALLAPRCDRYVATEISPTAVERARRRCAHLSHVEVHVASVADSIPTDPVDLAVLSEIGYYFDERSLASILVSLHDGLTDDAVVVGCHWLGSSPDHTLSGDRVHQVLASELGPPASQSRDDRFRLDIWRLGT